MSRLRNVSGALLLGGASTRMGRDKSQLRLGGPGPDGPDGPTSPKGPKGETLALRSARLLATLFDDVLLVGGEPPADAPGRAVPDGDGPRCALRGLVAALAAAKADRVLVVATDMPRLSPELLLALTAWPEADAVVPRDAQGLHPLCAIYRREPVLEAAKTNLQAERLALRALLDAVETDHLCDDDLQAVDPEGRALTNVNRPEDWAEFKSS